MLIESLYSSKHTFYFNLLLFYTFFHTSGINVKAITIKKFLAKNIQLRRRAKMLKKIAIISTRKSQSGRIIR